MTDIPASAFVAASNAAKVQLLDPNLISPPKAALLAPPPITPPPTLNQIIDNINKAIAADRAANVPGTTPNGPPDNFAFADLTTNVSGTTAGDAFKGASIVSDIKNQFLDLTPDNLLIRAITPNAFINSGAGNDLLIASSGHNILDGGSGRNTFVGGNGPDTFIQDLEKAGGAAFVINPGSGDDILFVGGDPASFSFAISDSPAGLDLVATAKDPTNTRSSEMILSGFKVSDIGTKLNIGLSSTPDSTTYAFVHVV
jgi:Ca2+-binding RTX toxin-like protein